MAETRPTLSCTLSTHATRFASTRRVWPVTIEPGCFCQEDPTLGNLDPTKWSPLVRHNVFDRTVGLGTCGLGNYRRRSCLLSLPFVVVGIEIG